MQKIVYHSDAKQEVIYSARYYELQCAGLGIKFLENYDKRFSILTYQTAYPDICEFRRAGRTVETDIFVFRIYKHA